MNNFRHTHTIVIKDSNGRTQRVAVDASESMGPDGMEPQNGVLYTEGECQDGSMADWELREGSLFFQGENAERAYAGRTVELRMAGNCPTCAKNRN